MTNLTIRNFDQVHLLGQEAPEKGELRFPYQQPTRTTGGVLPTQQDKNVGADRAHPRGPETKKPSATRRVRSV